MAIHIITVTKTQVLSNGLRIYPGIPAGALSRYPPSVGQITQGSQLVLRRPDGKVIQSHVATYGIPCVKDADGNFLVGADMEILIALPLELMPEDVPPGTEVWFVDSERGLPDRPAPRR